MNEVKIKTASGEILVMHPTRGSGKSAMMRQKLDQKLKEGIMNKLDEIIEELRAWAESCMWTTGHEEELHGMADELEAIREQIKQRAKQHYDDLLAKALKSASPAAVWHDAETDPPQPFRQVLLYLPEDAPMPTVHEGYRLEGGSYRTVLYGVCKPTKWRDMPEVEG